MMKKMKYILLIACVLLAGCNQNTDEEKYIACFYTDYHGCVCTFRSKEEEKLCKQVFDEAKAQR